jgi:hypothetical protein
LVVEQRLVLELRRVEHYVAHPIDAVPIFDDLFFGEQVGQCWIDLERCTRNYVLVVLRTEIAFEFFGCELGFVARRWWQ